MSTIFKERKQGERAEVRQITEENQWQRVIKRDGSNFYIFSANISQCVQRTSGERYNTEYLQPPVKQAGASVMV